MLDFKVELDKLLALETEALPEDGLAETLLAFSKKQADISLQVEEIYDLVQESETAELLRALGDEKRRVKGLAGAIIGLCDIIEDFREFAADGQDEALARQAFLMWRNAGKLLEGCGMSRVDGESETGRTLDPALHAVQSAAPSDFPREGVARVLRSGYRHMGETVRKAAVILSLGKAE